MRYVRATFDDLVRFYGSHPLQVEGDIESWEDWDAYCAKEGKTILGFSGYSVIDGNAWFFMNVLERVKRPVMYRYAVRFLKQLRESGINNIYAPCDISKPRAVEFLERLGFEETEAEVNGWKVWKHGGT